MKTSRIVLGCILVALGLLAGGAGAQVSTEFSAGISAGAGPTGITAGPDGNLWFIEPEKGRIGRITPAGVVTEFSAGATGITAGPDGNLWFTEQGGNRIGRITPAGIVTEFSAGISARAYPTYITAGPDGNLWFAEHGTPFGSRGIGRITPAGVVTEFSTGIWSPSSITAGPDGNLWFTESVIKLYGPPTSSGIGRITPLGVITEFSLSALAGSITAGPDGNLWFTEPLGGPRIGRITPAGFVTEFSAGITAAAGLGGITAGPDGNLWFTEPLGNRIGRITPDGVVTEFIAGITANASPTGITAGPDGNLWFTERLGNRIGQITTCCSPPPAITTVVSSVNPSQVGQAVVFTASVAGNLPTGTVQFMDMGWIPLGSPVTLSGGGIAQLMTSTLAEGSYSISAIYSGDLNNAASSSAVLIQAVANHPSSPATTTVVSSVNPSQLGQAIVFTASVAGNFPTGTVQFMDGGTALGSPVTLSGGGVAQLMTSTLTRGTHAITAVYSGDDNNSASTSSVLLQKVKRWNH